jgi:ligand-binding SRPBCC domain-containing protein
MKRYILERVQEIGKPQAEVFSFFERPENLARITPSSMRFEILSPGPITMAPGVLIDYTIRIFGMRRGWTTLIAEYDPPYQFVDEQLRGPYVFWQHTHHFDKIAGGTRMADRVEYIVPYGLFGRLIHTLFIRRQLNRIFDYRAQKIGQIFANQDDTPSDPAWEEG